MSMTDVTLHMLCGKIAAGKSTLAAGLTQAPGTVLIEEDVWLKALFGDRMATPKDFVRSSATLRAVMGPHVVALLRAGVSVVLDFQANTLESRAWMRALATEAGVASCLHYLEASDALCLERLRRRNAEEAHAFSVSEEQFRQISRYFVPPSADEGVDVVVHRQDAVVG